MNNNQNYKIPINFSSLVAKRELPTCNFLNSIAQNIFIVLTTKYDECRFDPFFGSEIWEWDFQHIPNEIIWLDKMSSALENTIRKYESRLYDIRVEIKIEQEEINDAKKFYHRIKKKLEVFVHATLTETREPFHFQQILYISPISFD